MDLQKNKVKKRKIEKTYKQQNILSFEKIELKEGEKIETSQRYF